MSMGTHENMRFKEVSRAVKFYTFQKNDKFMEELTRKRGLG